jgi:PAS domain S-box-containing protein
MARIEGRELAAERLYEQAIHSAEINGFIHNEALANELAARFYAARGFDKIAMAYLRDARYGYSRWGANGKVRQLDDLYPHLLDRHAAAGPISAIGAPIEQLDLATVIKVSQAVSGEIILERLIDTLLRTSIEHAGAGRGLLIFPRDVEPRVEAEITTSGDTVVVRSRKDGIAALPRSIVHYVARTQESVILDDASAPNPFSDDSYILERNARSILCLPLIHQTKLIGMLYLENNLATHVFTPARTALLKLIASQAAISLENTRLYSELEEREAKIRRLVDANILGIFIWDLEGRILEANEAFLSIVGYGREDLVSGRVRWTDLTPPEWRVRDRRAVVELKATGTLQPFETEYLRQDGTRAPVLVGCATILQGRGNEGVAFVLDLSEQKRAAEALRRSEAYLAEAQRLSHAGSFGWNVASGDLWWSEEGYRIFGYDSGTRPSTDLMFRRIHPEDQVMVRQIMEDAQRYGKDFDLEHRLLMPDGYVKYLRVAAHALKSRDLGGIEFVGSVMDITATRLAEQEIQALSDRLLTAQEEERIRIARELHDGLNQEIAAITLRLSRIHPALKEREPQVGEQLEKARQSLMRLSSNVRDLSHQLHPAILEHSDLATALNAAATEFSSLGGVNVSFEADGRFDDISKPVALCVYRIVQEALQNVAKHAGAAEASINLYRAADGLRLTVSDCGVGFHLANTRASGGLGLVSMRERVRLLRGVFQVESEPNRGTRIKVEIPLTAQP